jgi:hypothetical protein
VGKSQCDKPKAPTSVGAVSAYHEGDMAKSTPPSEPLSAADIEIVEFERAWWGSVPNKESAVRERFGLTLARYYQRVYALCEGAAALEYDAVFVRQYRQAQHMRQSARRLGPEGGKAESG